MCFQEGSASPEELYSESELSGSGTEEATDDDESYEDDDQDGATPESDAYTDDDLDNASSRSCSESGESGDSVVYKDKVCYRTLLTWSSLLLNMILWSYIS